MKTFSISQLHGAAYDNALGNVIAHVNRLGWGYDESDLTVAHDAACDLGMQFDVNGNFAN